MVLPRSYSMCQTSCGPKARATGEVHDGFGKSLAGVEVSIPGTALKTTAGSNGQYSISYVPGKFSINYSKDGYTTFNLNQDVSVETTVPLQVVVLYKKASDKGVWLFGDSDYMSLKSAKVLTSGGDRRQFAWVYKMTYCVVGDFTPVARREGRYARRHCVPTAIRGHIEKAPTLIID